MEFLAVDIYFRLILMGTDSNMSAIYKANHTRKSTFILKRCANFQYFISCKVN